ncbi:MAG: L-rhamnose mutarotase [Oscillibacter sp.]|nr:L-rhamnose mutarotase [Oscillibacter sp.]
MKRFCQTLKLKENPELIREYVKAHQEVWPEIKNGIREVGILDMEIYIHESILFMIVETTDDFDWVKDNQRLSTLPRQAEWEAYVARFQQTDPTATSSEKWRLMERIFKL